MHLTETVSDIYYLCLYCIVVVAVARKLIRIKMGDFLFKPIDY